ncbi:MAG: HAMP domain-containing histidine kinase, partial [Rhodospirillaceae bacterium]|nr:HAMP domain-containing histidine kinase [Rhodospirillaceae bacterium]
QMIASRFEKAGDGDGVELASLITTSGEHMHRNIQDILLMVSLQAKTFDPLEQNVTTIDLLQSVADRTKEQAETSNIKIKIDMAKDADVLIADAQMLARAVEVLVHNAILFSPNGGEVTLSAVNVGGKIQLSIRDHGPGMSDEKLTRALEMLTQGDGSLTRHHSGMGLGIPLAKGLTEAMGGIFEIKSGPQIGTEAILTFPSV